MASPIRHADTLPEKNRNPRNLGRDFRMMGCRERLQRSFPENQNHQTPTIMNPIGLKSSMRNTGCALVASLTLTAASSAADKPFSKIVTFGDSLSDTGNAFLYTGGLFPATPPNAAGRISNGALWIEHLAESLGMELQSEDQYAVAGARTDQDNFNAIFIPPLAGTGLESQIATYLNDGADPAALHTIWIGANDIFTTLTFGGDIGLTVYTAIQNTAQAVVTLSSGGARHILVVNLPDLGLTPFGLAQGPLGSAQLSYLTNLYNAGLNQALDGLGNAGIRTIRLDSAGLIREIAANPAAFGLVNASDMANGSGNDPSGYLFWNEVHPTTAGHRIVADRAVEELIHFYSPRKGRGKGAGLVHSLNGLVHASSR
jgi:phospholipase/lecithinase/hemolysin